MKQSTRLTSAVFQLTPTRTRCDLIIIAIDKKEKIASGLLNPFLAHLKTAQDQIARGGYSILLEPEKNSDGSWFTKATLERFVRFVSTPEILERVCTIETEILQIEEAIALQRSSNIGENTVEENRGKRSLGGYKGTGDKSLTSANEEKAIILYTPGPTVPEADGSSSLEGNSRVKLLKVLETRKTVLQKEQGMAFARAVAAGFDIDYMAHLVSFAECFGAMRLMEACLSFTNLWKSKHEMGQWLNIESSEALPARSDFCAANASGIILPDSLSKHVLSNHECAIDGKPGQTNNANSPLLNGQQEYFLGQFPHLVFPPWHMQTQPGTHPVFPAYPLPGMPYFQTYTGNGPFFQSHHYPMEHSPSSFGPNSKQENQSVDVSNSNTTDSEMREVDRARSLDEMESDAEVSCSRKPNKKTVSSNRKQPGKVVIQNINYITSKGNICASEANSDSQSDTGSENEYSDGNDVIHQNKKRSSKHGGNHKLSFNNARVSVPGKDTGDMNWLAFQDCLLREGSNEGAHDIQDDRMGDMHKINGRISHKLRTSGDEVMFSSAGNDFMGNNDQTDIHFVENDGRKTLIRTTEEDFASGDQWNRESFRNLSDPLAENIFDSNTNKKDRDYYSHIMSDETLLVPFRSMSVDQVGVTYGTAIDIDSEIPAKYQKLKLEGKVNYEPNDLSLMPERRTTGYNNIGLDYEMQVCAVEKEKNNVIVKDGLSNNSDKNRKSKVAPESSLHKQRTGGLVRKTKPSKMSPLEDARTRAESLRSYKADLQKRKKEQEEVQAKRLESLKMERQKRIAARVGSNSASPSTSSPQTKLSPTTNRVSKFSDSEPGSSSSPLQRSKTRISVRSSEPHKASMAGNRLTRSSSSSLSEMRRVRNDFTPDNSKVSMSRIRRLSEPKITISSPVTSTTKAESVVLKRKLSQGPERKTVSAINTSHDQSKAATIPELKVKTSKLSHVGTGGNASEVKEDKQKVNRIRTSVFPKTAELNVNYGNTSHQVNSDDSHIVEKTVLLLESENSCPTLHGDKGEKSNVTSSESAPIRTPLSPMNDIYKEAIACGHNQSDHDEVRTDYLEKDPPDSANTTASENPYRAPHARVSSLEDPCTHHTYYDKGPLGSSERLPRAEETVNAHVPDVKSLKLKTIEKQVNSEKILVKEPSKGFKRLLMFGRKRHTSSSVDQIIDSEESTGGSSIRHEHNGPKTASTSEVDTLKNLITQDETSASGNAPKKSPRPFSLFSHFRRKNK